MKLINYSLPLLALTICLFTGQISLGQIAVKTCLTPHSQYNLKININVKQDVIAGSGQITITNCGNKPVEKLAFCWPLLKRYSLEVIHKGITLELCEQQDPESDSRVYKLHDILEVDDQLTIKIKFEKSLFLNSKNDQIYLRDRWYPKLMWENNSSPDDYTVKLTFPNSYQIGVTGTPIKGRNTFQIDQVKEFAVYLGKDQEIYESSIEGVMVKVICPYGGQIVGEQVMETLKSAIPFYINEFGYFPFKQYHVIPGDSDYPKGGYNYAPGIAVIHGMQHHDLKGDDFWTWITVHELCHHYWGEHVFDGDQPSWLCIGLGIYMDKMYMDHIQNPYPVYRNFQSKYYYGGVQPGHNTTLAASNEAYQSMLKTYDWNNVTRHGKGYTVIRALESIIEKQNMLHLYKSLLKKYAWKEITTQLFQIEVESLTKIHLDWFFDQWVRSNKHLGIEVNNYQCVKNDDGYMSTIYLNNTGNLFMPVPVRITFEDGTTTILKTDRESVHPVLRYQSKSPLKAVQPDPDHYLPLFGE